MDTFATYNKVKSLTQEFYGRLLSSVYLLLIFIIVSSISCLLLGIETWPVLNLTLIASPILLIVIYIKDKTSKRQCRYCQGGLIEITRPLILTPEYLAMNGHKKGNYFYAYYQQKFNPFKKQWTKISHHSMACQHCRLTEEKKFKRHVVITESEINNVLAKK